MSDLNFFREQADSVIEFWGDDSTEALSDAEDYMMMHRALADAPVLQGLGCIDELPGPASPAASCALRR